MPIYPTGILSKTADEVISASIDFTSILSNDALSSIVSNTPKYRSGDTTLNLSVSSGVISTNVVNYTISGGLYNYSYFVDTLVSTTGGQILLGQNLVSIDGYDNGAILACDAIADTEDIDGGTF